MRKIIRFICVSSLLMAAASCPAWAQNSLNEFITAALRNNAGLKAAKQRYLASLRIAPQVSALPETRFGFGYFLSPVETRLGPQQATFSVAQSFPWFGTLAAAEDAADARALSEREALTETRNRVVLDVKTLWYEAYVLERTNGLTDGHIELLRSLRNVVLSRFESGRSGMTNVLRIEMEIERLLSRQEFLLDARHPLEKEFSRLLGSGTMPYPAFPDTLQMMDFTGGRTELEDSLLAKNTDINRLHFEAEFWDHKRAEASKQGYPSFVVGLSYTLIGERTDAAVTDNGRDAFVLPQIGISLPLFGSANTAREDEARYRHEAARSAIEEKQRELEHKFEDQYQGFREAERNIRLSRRMLELAGKAWGIAMDEFSVGKTTIDEIISLQRDLLQHAVDLEQARADRNTAVARINYLTAKNETLSSYEVTE